jgi:phosphate-selective porin OprO/OprP
MAVSHISRRLQTILGADLQYFRSPVWLSVCVLAAFGLVPGRARAHGLSPAAPQSQVTAADGGGGQTTPPPEQPRTVPPFVVQSDQGENRLQLAFLGQVDGRFSIDDSQAHVTDTFLLRRLRPILQGRVAKNFEFLFTPDFGNGNVAIRDAYFDTRFSDGLRVRLGKGKVPFSLERLHGAASLLFVERGFPTIVAPDRDTGVQVLGDLFGSRVSYAGAVVNGSLDGGSPDADANDGKDLAGRIVIRPWSAAASPLAGLGFALAGSEGIQPASLPSFRTSGQQTFFSYSAGTAGEGRRHRVSPQGFYYRGPFGGFGEYVRSIGDVRKGTLVGDIDHRAWQVAISWVATGEAATDRGVRPRSNFDPESHRWGALQLAVRYHRLSVDPDALALGFAAPGSSRTAGAFTAGANWYLNPFVKWAFNVERTVFDAEADGERRPENAVMLRGQLSF